MMKRFIASLPLALLLLLSNPSFPQWERDELPDGSESCLNTETGERILLETRAGNWASRDCRAFTLFVDWLQTAEAALSLGSIVQNVDGTINAQYPDGSKPPGAATLTWNLATIDPVGALVTGSAYSDDVRACCLSGTAAATAVITLTDTTGAQCGDWSISMSDNLINAGSNAGSCSFRLRATDSGQSVNSDVLNALYSAPPVPSDTQAPPVPTGMRVTGTATNQVSVEHDAVCDNHDGTSGGGGTKQYNYRRDTTAIETVAATPCNTPALTQTIVGSSDGTPSSTQTGNDWALSFGGTGLGGTTDNLLTRGTAISGDAWVSGYVSALSGGGDFPKTGIYLTASEASGVVGCWLHRQNNAAITPPQQVQMRCRTTADAATVQVFNIAPSTATYTGMRRTQSTNQVCGYYSTDGGEWTEGGCTTIVLPTSVRCGVYLTAQSASSQNATSTVENFNCHALPKVTRDLTTTMAGSFNVSADDDADNESAFSTGASGTPGTPPAAGALKWHPGHYMQLNKSTNESRNQSIRFGYYDQSSFGPNTDFEGVQVWFRWIDLEGAQGDYSSGISLIQAEVNKLKSLSDPKRLIIRLFDRGYGPCSSQDDDWPAYIRADANNYWEGGSGICNLRRWEPAVMDRLIALFNALGAAFDDEPYVEAIVPFQESVINAGGGSPPNYSDAALDTQYRRLADAFAESWPTTIASWPLNWAPSPSSRMISFVAYLESLDQGFGDPDTHINQNSTSDQIMKGDIGPGAYTGVIPLVKFVESSSLGYNSQGNYTIQQIGDYVDDTLAVSHMLWERNTYIGVDNSDPTIGQRLSAILTYIAADPLNNTACPSAITQGCDTN